MYGPLSGLTLDLLGVEVSSQGQITELPVCPSMPEGSTVIASGSRPTGQYCPLTCHQSREQRFPQVVAVSLIAAVPKLVAGYVIHLRLKKIITPLNKRLQENARDEESATIFSPLQLFTSV